MTSLDIERANNMIVLLLANRVADATLCPSGVARALVVERKCSEWRAAMPAVHAAIDSLLHTGAVRLSWKDRPLKTRSGPYRIAFGSGVQREP